MVPRPVANVIGSKGKFGEMIDYIAARGKRAILFTNGTLLSGERLARIARSRLSVLNVSVEVDEQTAYDFRTADQGMIGRNVEAFIAARQPTTQVKVSVLAHAGNVERLDRVRTDWGDLVDQVKISSMTSFSGSGRPSLCTEPWRGNLNILTSGQVSPCCVDWGAFLTIGNLNDQDLDEIVHGPAYRKLLRRFLAGEVPDVCRRCEEFTDPRVPLRIPRHPLNRPS